MFILSMLRSEADGDGATDEGSAAVCVKAVSGYNKKNTANV